MNKKEIIGIILVLSGIILGLYLGVWICFIGGIVQVVSAFKQEEIEALSVAVGILRTISASFVGFASAALLIMPGASMLK